ncbi:MAG TPA: hypothetical protein VJZ25_07095 [Gemmatimonadaceae bacterium]|nr:hypothetical protein [Gemmatimonadaceae bacterium]
MTTRGRIFIEIEVSSWKRADDIALDLIRLIHRSTIPTLRVGQVFPISTETRSGIAESVCGALGDDDMLRHTEIAAKLTAKQAQRWAERLQDGILEWDDDCWSEAEETANEELIGQLRLR